MEKYKFIKKIEQLINSQDVATLQTMSPFMKWVPKKIQNKIISQSAQKNPYMGFVVEPYSVFLCYEIKDLEQAKALIPDNFSLIKTKIFTEDEPKYYMIFTCFNVHSSAFWGTRLEVNIIAENKETGLLSWLIIDYDTNTLSYDKKNGLMESNAEKALVTTDFEGNIIVDIKNSLKKRSLIFDCQMSNSKLEKLDQRLWLEGNLSVGYGKEISLNSSDVFSLKFDPKEVEKGFNIPLEQVNIVKNTWYEGLIDTEPTMAVYFPYAQHYLSDSPGHFSLPKNELEMVKQVKELDLDHLPLYSSASIRKMFVVGIAMNFFVFVTLIILLFLK
ncbi:hypothetical protein [Enterococcus rivorum]|uniref:Uncharacterized protein n=2 Tax=Enterococcus rivorum TaxID=762845 RepID=A0A1E5L1L6_9ENTE|nr:hypothetical protein [Enterococcus rivorum]MBP2098762.1 hypothetical protein [Enterococcus rivorum]OEH83953.1 hypothetical protein BCR26_00315 [Enterococcus rivorum]